jgi:soluble lytic murein transglycosylase-like protein
MNRFDIRKILASTRLQSASFTLVAIATGAGIAMKGPLVDPSHLRPLPGYTEIAAELPKAFEQPAVAVPDAQQPEPEVIVMAEAAKPERKTLVSRLSERKPVTRKASLAKSNLPNLDHVAVDKWIRRFTTDLKRSLEIYLVRMEAYDEMIAKKAKQQGVPQDLVYLAMIESGGNATATSPVGARGLWQFMAPTAKEYGLKSSERLNPEKSTDAALEYLGDLYDRFGSWYLAAAAYNTGQGRVAKVLKQVTGKTRGTDADYYRIAKRLPQETRDYVPKLVAAARIAKDPAKYGLNVKGTQVAVR